MRHSVASRRTQLLARSALCGVLGALAIGASAAAAQVTGVGEITSTNSNGGAVGVSSGGGVTDITTNAGRSIVNWANLTVTPTEALNFYFNNRSDIVVNRVAGAASVNGILNGCMATCAVNGGNIWILSAGGVLIGANAQVNTGGFLASTGDLTDLDILDGDMNFAFTGAPTNSVITVAGGASLNTNGGSLALIAPVVTTGAGSTVTATNGGDVVYGSAENYNVTFAPTGADDLDLLTFQVPSQSDGSSGTPGLTLEGATTANQVFAAIVSKSGVASSILLGGNITATTAAGENGDIVLSAGSGFTNGVAGTPMGFDGSITQNTTSTLTGDNVTMRASDDIVADEINATGQVRLDSIQSSITQTGGITAGLLDASAGAAIALGEANAVANLGDLTAGGTSDITFVNGGDLALTGDITSGSGGVVTITSISGAIDQASGAITADWIKLNAGTTIDQGGGATLTSTALSLTSGGNVSLGEANSFTSIYDLAVAGDLTLRNGGSIDMGPVLSGFYNAAGALNLTSDTGSIFTTGAGVVTSRLTASAAGSITLDGTIGSLGDVTAGGNILLNNYSTAMDLTGDVTGQTVSLYAGGGVTQSGGRIDASRINVITNGAISLTGANEIDVVGRLDTDWLLSGTGDDITLRNVGTIVLDYLVAAPGATVLFTSDTGGITQTSFSAITAGTLTASAAGNVTIYDGGNDVTTIGGLASTNGDIVYRDVNGFGIQGDITANSTFRGVMLVAGGAGSITQTSGVLDVGFFRGLTGGSITLGGANQIRRLITTTIGNGTLTLNTTTDLSVDGTVVANAVSLSSTGAVTQATNAQIWTNTLNASAVTGVNLTASGFGANNIGALGTITNTTSGGITLSNAMNFNLTGNITASGQAVSITNTQGSINQTGGIITAGLLSLSATTGISATRNNVFDGLGAVAAGGNVAIVNVGHLMLTDNVNTGGGDLSLTSNTGQIWQPGGVITANVLNLGAGGSGGISLNQANVATSLGVVISNGNVQFRNDGNTVVGGDITAAGFNVTLRSNTGSVTQTAGSDIIAGSLQVMAETGVTLTNAGNAINQLAGVDVASGGVAFGQWNGYQISGAVSALGQSVNLSSVAGAITQLFGSSITAGTLNVGAASTLNFNQANNVTSLGVISTGGSFLFRDIDSFDLTGNITLASQLVMLAQNGSVNQTSGIITADSINAMATVDLLLGGANEITTISALSAGDDLLYRQVGDLSLPAVSVGGALGLYSTTGSLTQTGAWTAATLNGGAETGITLNNSGNVFGALGSLTNTTGGGIAVVDANDLDLTGAITANGQTVTLNALAGGFTQQTGASITAGTLILDAAMGAQLEGANDVDSLGPVATGVSLSFRDVDGFDIAGTLNATTIDLAAGGALTQSSGVITGTNLSLSAASVTLDGANDIATLGAVDVTGDMSFRDIGDINLNGNQTVGGALSLTSGAIIRQIGSGVLDTDRFQANAVGGVLLGNSGNAVASLGDISTTSGAIYITNASPLTIDGDLTATGAGGAVTVQFGGGGVTMTNSASIATGGNVQLIGAGDIVLGAITADRLSTISHSGAISSTAAPTIVVNRLTGSAADSFVLTGSNIDINEFAFNAADEISVTGNNGPLDLIGQVTAQTVTLGSTGAITQSGGLVRATVATLSGDSIVANRANEVQTVNLNGSSISFTNAGSFAANVITSTGAVSLTSNTGQITQTALTGRIVADSLTASAATGLEFFGGLNDIRVLAGLGSTGGGVTWRDMGGFEIAGNINAAGQTVELVSDGTGADGTDVTQSSGVITADRLQGTSAGDLLFTSANVVGQLGSLNAGGNIRYRGAASFTLQDNVNAGGGLILNADTGSIQQFGGVIVADAFAGTAAQGISLSRVNDVDFLGVVDSGAGDFNFRDVDAFDIAGLITSDTGIMLEAGSNITQSSGSIVTGTLSLFASGTAVVNGSGNDIDFLGLSTGMNALAFTDVDGFGISDRVFSSGAISLTATTGDIAEVAGGYLSANGLSVYAGNGEIDLAGDNIIENVGDLMAGGDVTFHETDGFLTFGNIAGDAVRLTTAAGGISQINGAIGANSLLVSAHTGIELSQAGNAVDTIAGMNNVASGGIAYTDVDSVSIAGAVTAVGQTVTFNVGGNLTQSGTGIITAQTVAGSAGGAFALADAANEVARLGPVTAGSIDLVTVDTGLTIVGALTANNGVVLKADDFITQTTAGTITANILRAQADGDIILDQANDLASITLLYSDLGDITYSDVDGFSLDGSSIGDFWTSGTFTLTAGGTGGITQSGVGLRAGTLLLTAGGDITLDEDNRIDVLGTSSAGGSVFQVVNLGDLDVAGDISVAHPLGALALISNTGKVEQTTGEIDAYTVGGASAGDFILTHFTGGLGDITTTAGDIDITNAGDIALFGTLHTDAADSVTLTSTGGGIAHGVGRIETGTLNLDAATSIALDGAQSNDVERLGTVRTYANFTFRNDDSLDLNGDIDVSMPGGSVGLMADTGAITQSGGVITAYDLTLQTTGGMDLSGANRVDQLTVNNGSTASVGFVNARALNVLGVASSGRVNLETTAGLLTVSGGVTTDGEIRLTGAGGVLATGFLGTIGDVTVTAAAGDIEIYDVTVGDDLAVTASDGDAQVRNLTLTGSSDGEADGGNAFIFASGDAFLGARDEAGIGSQTVNRAGGVGEIVVASTGAGDAGVFLQNANAQIDLSAGADGTATYVLASGDLRAGNVSGTHVVLKANAGAVNAGLVILGGGDYALHGEDFSTGAFGFIGAARDITITDTAGLLELTANLLANRNLTITAVGSVVDGTGAVNLLAGLDADDTGVLTVTAASISLAGAGADGDVTLTATSGNVDVATVGVSGDYTLSGAGFSAGALSPIGATAGTWSLTDLDGFDFTGLMLTYNGDIEIQAGDTITGGNVQSITGSVTIDGPDDIDVEGLYAAADITVDSGANLTLDSATSYGGDITLTGGSVTVEGFAEAGGDVLISANNGAAEVNAATAGGNITVRSTNGDAILGAAALTGPTGDLLVSADAGDVVFGVLDYSTVSSDNVFSRAAGGAGTATLTSTTGDVTANLWSSARLDLVQAYVDAEVSAETGDLEIGQLQSTGGEVYAEAVDGDLTIDEAYAATGFLGLYAGGDLTILGAAHGYAGVEVETAGLLDGSLANAIFSGGDMVLTGGSVLVNRVVADGNLSVAAVGAGGDVRVGFAETDGFLIVGSLDGDATLGGGEAVDGIQLFGFGTVTLGADSRALISNQNYVSVSGGGCGCGPGDITVVSQAGDVRVNLDTAAGVFDAIGAAIDGDVEVAILSGDLTIADLAGYNITVDVGNGSLETGYGDPSSYGVFLSGGNYSVRASAFLGNALTPNLPFGGMNDYTVVDTGGGLDMGPLSVTAQGDILIEVRGSGVLTGSARLASTTGDVTVLASQIRLDSVDAAADVVLNAGLGVVDVLNTVTVGGDYTLTGADFSPMALDPLGARTGDLTITDTSGGFYMVNPLTYGGDISITAAGAIVTDGTITSNDGDILLQGGSVIAVSLSAANGGVDAYAYGGVAIVGSATAEDHIYIYNSTGDASLGAATLLGTGSNSLNVHVDSGTGNAVFGSDTAGGVTTANTFTDAGSNSTVAVSSAGGGASVNLYAADAIDSVFGGGNVQVAVLTGDFDLGSAYAFGGRVDVEGPDGQLAIGALTAATDVDITGADITLTDGVIGGDLTVAAAGDIAFGGPGGIHSGQMNVAGEVSLGAGGGVSQNVDARIVAGGLTLDAGDAVSLPGANRIDVLRDIQVASGGFAYRSVRVGGVDIAGAIHAAGQVVDLRVLNGGISQSGGAVVAGRLTGSSDGGVYLAGGNLIGELGDFANAGGAFLLNVDQTLGIVGLVDSDSALTIRSKAMTIASTGAVRSTAAGDAVVLAADGVFTNHSGADGVQAANGRWLIYSQAAGDPEGSTTGNDFGGLDGRSWYDSAYDFGTGAFAAAPNAGNRFVYGYQPTLTVTPVSQRITYNGQIPTVGALIAGFINGDVAADAWSGAPTISGADSKNVGTYGLYAALGSLASDMNYAFLFDVGTLIIDPKTLTGTVMADNKVYDGATDATGVIGLDGVVAGDAVVATANGFQFADRNAGLGKIVTALGAALSGADAGNYTLGSVGTAIADILRRSLTGVVTANDKTYDGTTAATGSIGLTGVVAGDAVAASATSFSFADRNAGVGKVVTANGAVLSGADAVNYDLGPISGVADILRRSIGGTVVASNKTYDGSTAATGTINLTGVVAGDDIRAGGSLAFDDRNAGAGRTVSAANTALSGADAGNYTLTGVANGIADILRRAINVQAHNQSKRFGQTDPSLTYVTGGEGLVQGDVLTGGLARAAGENAGVYAIGQGDLAASSNYILTFTPGEFVIQVPPAGGIQSLQMVRSLGETSAFALDRDPGPGLIVGEVEDERDPEDRTGPMSD